MRTRWWGLLPWFFPWLAEAATPPAPAREASPPARVAVQLFGRAVELAARGPAVGLGHSGARYLGAAEVRWRFLGGRLYALGTGGTLLFPAAEGTFLPAAFASVGLGVDDAR
jgi:hypothetical protein